MQFVTADIQYLHVSQNDVGEVRIANTKFETEFDANALLIKILHFSTCKKSPRVLNTHSFKRVLLDD